MMAGTAGLKSALDTAARRAQGNPGSGSSGGGGGKPPPSDLMMMGFPTRLPIASPVSLCACHGAMRKGGYLCPRCGAKVCEVPTDCEVCGLMVVSSPHLARRWVPHGRGGSALTPVIVTGSCSPCRPTGRCESPRRPSLPHLTLEQIIRPAARATATIVLRVHCPISRSTPPRPRASRTFPRTPTDDVRSSRRQMKPVSRTSIGASRRRGDTGMYQSYQARVESHPFYHRCPKCEKDYCMDCDLL